MTPAKSGPTNVVVVDGSNIATEGRSMPSLSQLNDAVMAFTEEFPDAVITVVVDATFGHRIDKKELAEFDAAVAHNEVVAPPAGAIGRGDAFVLSIANKVGARILSNDSFQEFHGDYPWLFDEGRLIGGKPVPFVGWVFVERLPVKGPVSRKATRTTRGGGSGSREARPSRRTASREASLPMPVPTAPPPAARRSQRQRAPEPVAAAASASVDAGAELARSRPPRQDPSGEQVNDVLPFLEFVEHHPIGSSVNGVVESYSSHGAYVTVDDVRGYVPLRLMGDPPPRSAREMMKLGDAVTLVVTSFAPARRSVDMAIPSVAPITDVVATPMLEELAEAVAPARSTSRRGKKAAAAAPEAAEAPRPRRGRAKAAAEPVETAADVDAAPVVAAAPDVPAPEASPAKRTAAKRAPAKRAPAKKAVAEQAAAIEPPTVPDVPAPAAKKAPAKRGAAKAAAEPAPAPAPKSRGRTSAARVAEPAPTPDAPAATGADAPATAKPARKRAAKKAAAAAPAPDIAAEQPAASPAPAKRAARKRSAAAAPEAS